MLITFTGFACIVAMAIVFSEVIIPKLTVNKAMELLNSGDLEAAHVLLEKFGNVRSVASGIYDRALELADSGDYDTAYFQLRDLDYEDSSEKLKDIRVNYLSQAQVDSYVFSASMNRITIRRMAKNILNGWCWRKRTIIFLL